MIEVSAEAWHATPYLITPWQYLPRLGIRLGLACCSTSCHTLAVSAEAWHAFLISYRAFAVSAEAWHFILYLITPWQYLPRLCMLSRKFLYYHALAVSAEAWHAILSRLGSICRGLACFSILSRLGSICLGLTFYSISYHALVVSTKGSTSKNPSYKSSS